MNENDKTEITQATPEQQPCYFTAAGYNFLANVLARVTIAMVDPNYATFQECVTKISNASRAAQAALRIGEPKNETTDSP